MGLLARPVRLHGKIYQEHNQGLHTRSPNVVQARHCVLHLGFHSFVMVPFPLRNLLPSYFFDTDAAAAIAMSNDRLQVEQRSMDQVTFGTR